MEMSVKHVKEGNKRKKRNRAVSVGRGRNRRQNVARKTIPRSWLVVGVTLLEHPEVVGVCGLRFMSALMEL